MGKALAAQAALTPPDLEADYNNRALAPDHPDIIARWRQEAQAVRARHAPEVLEYGPGERERIDWIDAGPHAPVAVFLHGGYWQAMERDSFTWVAPALTAHRISVAVVGYDLAPGMRLGRIVGQVRRAVDLIRQRSGGRRPLVFGHSAGGHMAACMLSEGRARAALAISGLFDLEPLIHTSLNAALDLTGPEARALSPIHWPAPDGSTPGGHAMDFWVGANESPAFIRQSREMAAAWGGKGVETHVELLDGLNHFTVLDPLRDPQSALVRRLVELAKAD